MRMHAHASTRGTSMLQPTTVSTRPSSCGSSNHIPSIAPSLASTRSERVLRWSGAANSSIAPSYAGTTMSRRNTHSRLVPSPRSTCAASPIT